MKYRMMTDMVKGIVEAMNEEDFNLAKGRFRKLCGMVFAAAMLDAISAEELLFYHYIEDLIYDEFVENQIYLY